MPNYMKSVHVTEGSNEVLQTHFSNTSERLDRFASMVEALGFLVGTANQGQLGADEIRFGVGSMFELLSKCIKAEAKRISPGGVEAVASGRAAPCSLGLTDADAPSAAEGIGPLE